MKLLLTRPEQDGVATARRLVALGHKVIVAPATEIFATGNVLRTGNFDVLLATSANAIRAIAPDMLEALRDLPLHCVGQKTASVAREAGFRVVHVGGGSGERLVDEIREAYPPSVKLLYLTGTPRKPMVEEGLKAAGFSVTALDLYGARSVANWLGNRRGDLESVDAALHFSRASVEALLDLAEKAGMMPNFRQMRHLCLSNDVAAPLLAAGLEGVVVSSVPTEDGVFAML
jgi:uroporphyrinogen-III synthase